jgi:hypothetical protein
MIEIEIKMYDFRIGFAHINNRSEIDDDFCKRKLYIAKWGWRRK